MKGNALFLCTYKSERKGKCKMNNNKEILQAYRFFLNSFELVFHDDWEKTKVAIQSNNYISDNGTFLDPCIEDEGNNWANRGGLLDAYRSLKKSLGEKPVTIKDTGWEYLLED